MNSSNTLGCANKTYRKPSSGHTSGDRQPGQGLKKPKDLSVCDRGGSWVWGGCVCVCCVFSIVRSVCMGWYIHWPVRGGYWLGMTQWQEVSIRAALFLQSIPWWIQVPADENDGEWEFSFLKTKKFAMGVCPHRLVRKYYMSSLTVFIHLQSWLFTWPPDLHVKYPSEVLTRPSNL